MTSYNPRTRTEVALKFSGLNQVRCFKLKSEYNPVARLRLLIAHLLGDGTTPFKQTSRRSRGQLMSGQG